MKKTIKRISVLLMVVAMVLVSTVPAFAATDGVYEVIYKGGSEDFVFTTSSSYTNSDLFAEFKDVMPGDTRTQTIDIINSSTESDYIKLYLQAVPHNEQNRPVTEELKNVDTTVMENFLNQMKMTVVNSLNNQTVFEGQAGELDGLTNAVYLGKLDHGDASLLTVTLTMPSSVGNEYSERIGEVDWKFIVEQFNYTQDSDDEDDETYKVTVKKIWRDGNSKSRPERIKVRLTRKGKVVDTITLSEKNNWRYTWHDLDYKSGWDVEEVEVPKGYRVSYDEQGRVFTITNVAELEQTGQLNWPIPILIIAGVLLMATGASLLRKGRKNA